MPGQLRAEPAGDAEMRVLFVVSVPPGTPDDAVVCVSGALPALGSWRADGLKLTRGSDGRYAGSVKLPTGEAIEYKITRGDWRLVERDAHGADIPNRRLIIDPRCPRVEISVASWAKLEPAVGEKKHTISGEVKYHHGFESRIMKNARTLAVYLPPSYASDKTARYPVLYMHDGQNVFDSATSFAGEWRADEHAEELIRDGRIEPLIIVGIYNNSDRMNEYSPDRDEKRGAGGRGEEYAKFLVEEVKPFIDRSYRTKSDRAHTGVAGSSMGGLISLYVCWKHPHVFSRCGIISPALMWNDASILKKLENDHDWMKGMRFWLDMGTSEGRQIDTFSKALTHTRRLARIFDSAGLKVDGDYVYKEVERGEHNEAAWAERFDEILKFLYPAKESRRTSDDGK